MVLLAKKDKLDSILAKVQKKWIQDQFGVVYSLFNEIWKEEQVLVEWKKRFIILSFQERKNRWR